MTLEDAVTLARAIAARPSDEVAADQPPGA
jgi:hypothetical protein